MGLLADQDLGHGIIWTPKGKWCTSLGVPIGNNPWGGGRGVRGGSHDVAAVARFRRGWLAVVSTLGALGGGCHCVYLMMFPSASSIKIEKGANSDEK